ncbi:MAG: phosphate signaling complex protein PhoU [Candidatus Thermoplasmatota archaeon]|nr:phosphate signaling complex protein PhoU [Candidatus Thermoplasmatota archaeon]
MGQKTRKSYHHELDELKEMVEEMGDLSSQAISLAIDSLVDLDEDKIERVQELDKKIYAYDRHIERKGLKLIALQAPVAKDLRIIGTCLKIITDLDRIGRYSGDIAKVSKRMLDQEHMKKLVSIPRMAELTIEMVDLAVQAFMEEDETLIDEIYEKEESVDALYDEIFREVLTYMIEDSSKITQGTQYVLVIRYLERIADHACNIAERIVYMETGEMIEHDVEEKNKNGLRDIEDLEEIREEEDLKD